MANLVIRQFDVLRNPNEPLRGKVPFAVAIQSHFLDALDTTIVAPLFRPEVLPPEREVMLLLPFEQESFVLNVALLANIEKRLLGRSLGSVAHYESEVRRAIDRLLTGF